MHLKIQNIKSTCICADTCATFSLSLNDLHRLHKVKIKRKNLKQNNRKAINYLRVSKLAGGQGAMSCM